MSRLFIDAANGAEYLAKARLESDAGQLLAQGTAVLASRQAFSRVRQGEYTFARIRRFPDEDRVQQEFGRHGLLFDPADPAANEPLLVHGGAFEHDGRPKAACGSIRLDARLLAAIVQHVQSLGDSAARTRLVLDVRVGSKPSALKFWAQPRREEEVYIDFYDDVDFFDILMPSLAPYRHPNSALAWMLYDQEERRQDERRRVDEQERRETERDRREERERVERERLELEHRDMERDEKARDDATACERPQGRLWDDDRQPVKSERSASPDAAPLFKVSQPPGVDAQGRVLDAGIPLGQCMRSDEQEAKPGGLDTATRSTVGLTLATLAGVAVAGESAGADWAASGDAPSAAAEGVGAAMSAGSLGSSDSTSGSLVESATSY